MRRNLTSMSASILSLGGSISFSGTRSPNLVCPLRLLFQHPSIGTWKSGMTFPAEPLVFKFYFSSREVESDVDRESEDDTDCEVHNFKYAASLGSSHDAKTILVILSTYPAQEKCIKLDECGVKVSHELVSDVISRTRNDWEKAFTFFLWAGKQHNYEHSIREYHSMIAILGKFRKFDTAWSLINDLQAAALLTPRTLLIMIWKYAAVHDVAKAINTFYAHKRYKFEIGMDEFQGLLSALSRYKNVKDAEHLLFCNQTAFPLNTKSFNIILNGWFNVMGDLREGNRIWWEMGKRGIRHDVYSYSSIMACYSRFGNMKMVLKQFDRMKALGIEPDRKVYNAVIHALAKGAHVKEARNLMSTMEEKGFAPNSITYNSLIKPLCKLRLYDEAKQVFDEMIERHCIPTVRTYHAFFRVLRTGETVFELLQKMYDTKCNPSHDTYIMLIRKFCRWRQLDNVFKLWNEMKENGLDHDRSSYIVLIHGLFLNGKLEEAHKYYQEMKEKYLLPEPKTEEMLQAWFTGKEEAKLPVTHSKDSQFTFEQWKISKFESKKNHSTSNHLQRQPESKRFARERGFSFLDQ